jgi:hypothetical protein
MKGSCLAGAAIVALMASACAQQTTREVGGDVSVDAGAMPSGAWGTNFRGTNGWERLRGSAFAQLRDKGTRVALTVERGFAGSNYGWDVREGTCGTPGAIVGNPESYPPLFIGEKETDSKVADLDVALDRSKSYVVRVYTPAAERTTMIGCGALRL